MWRAFDHSSCGVLMVLFSHIFVVSSILIKFGTVPLKHLSCIQKRLTLHHHVSF